MVRDNTSVSGIRAMTALVIVGTFLAGAITGAGVYHWVAPHHGRPPHGPGGPPFGELDLSDEQDAKLHSIMEAHRPELEAVLRETFPKVRAVHEKIDREVRAILTPPQQKRFDRWKADHPDTGRPPDGPGFGPPHFPPPPDR
jgi:Spy/CpxP family protein refolding chaperone